MSSLLHAAHIWAEVAWIGGIFYILFVLFPAMPRVALRDRAHFVPVLLRRFLRVVWASFFTLLLTGLYRSFWVFDGLSTTFWTSTPQGRLLAIKLGFVAALLGLAIAVTFRVVPSAITHLATHQEDPPDRYTCPQCATILGGMRRHLQFALILATAIIIFAVRIRA